jgi:hypothetical protein
LLSFLQLRSGGGFADEKFWLATGCVYVMECTRCPEGHAVYIGETGRPLQTRIKEHCYACRTQSEASALALHYKEEHPDPDFPETACLPLEYKISLLEKSLLYTRRKIREAVHIAQLDPSLNRKYEANKCNNLIYLELDNIGRKAVRRERLAWAQK